MATVGSQRRLRLLAAFFLPVLLYMAVLAATRTVPFGSRSLLMWDALEQNAAYLPYWRSVLLGARDLWYSLGDGLGKNMAGLIGMCLSSPVNALLILFPQTAFPFAFSVLVLVRVGLCGLTFYVFLRKAYDCGPLGLLFSTSYALMGMFAAYFFNQLWADAYVLLPLVALGLRRIVYRREPRLYLASLAALLFSNYYMGYIVCLFSALYFAFLWLQRPADAPFAKGERAQILAQFAGASLLAAGLAAVLLIPSVYFLGRGYESDLSLLAFTRRYTFAGIMSKLYTGASSVTQTRFGGLPNIYVGIPLLSFLPLYFFNRNISLRKRLLSAGLILVFLASFRINALYYAWHGFEQPTWYEARFSFLLCFLLIDSSWQGFSRLRELSQKRMRLLSACAAAGFLMLTYFLFRNLTVDYVAYKTVALDAAVFAASSAALVLLAAGKLKRLCVLLLCGMQAACLLLNCYYPIVRLREVNAIDAPVYEEQVKQKQSLVDRVQAADGGVYRMETNVQITLNDPLLFHYAGLTNSGSDIDWDTLAFTTPLGMQRNDYSAWYGGGEGPVLESVLGVKYVLRNDDLALAPLPESYRPLWTENGVTGFENTLVLPLAYMVPAETAKMHDYNPFVNQNELLSDLTGEEVRAYEPVWEIGQAFDGTWATYTFAVRAGKPLYLYSRGSDYRLNGGEYAKESLNGTVLLPAAAEDTTYTLQMTAPLGIHLAYFDAEAFQKAQAILAAHAAAVSSDTDSHLVIQANVADTFTQLLITLPYDEGWRVWVDGERAEATARYGALLAVNLTRGEHTVELHFTPRGLWAGFAVSAVSLALAMLWAVGRRRSRR